MSRGIRIGFGAAPLTLPLGTGRYGLMAAPSKLATTATAATLALGSGTYVYTGESATLVNSGAGTGPSAVTNLQNINQAGTGTTNTLPNTQKFSWGAASPQAGTTIASYNVYRNGSLYANTTSLNYTDSSATNSSECATYVPTTLYAYAVTAVDSNSVEGPKAYPSVYLQYQGISYCMAGGANPTPDYSYGLNLQVTWGSTGQAKSPATQSLKFTSSGGGFQPYTNSPVCPGYVMHCGEYTYYTFDMYAPSTLDTLSLALHSRPGGVTNPSDVYSMYITPVISGGVSQGYGTWTPNTWCTFKVPIQPLGIGAGSFVGSVTGGNLTVTSVTSGTGPDAGCYVVGGTLPAGTFISSANGNSSSIATFPLTNGPGNTIPNQASQTFTSQRYTLYKPDMHMVPTTGTIDLYFDNFGFSTV